MYIKRENLSQFPFFPVFFLHHGGVFQQRLHSFIILYCKLSSKLLVVCTINTKWNSGEFYFEGAILLIVASLWLYASGTLLSAHKSGAHM